VKEACPLELAENAVQRRITGEPAFVWWVPPVLKKRCSVIGKVKFPKSAEEAKAFDEENGDALWWDATCKEMQNVRPAFEAWKQDISALPPGCQKITCHMIFDVKEMGGDIIAFKLSCHAQSRTSRASILHLWSLEEASKEEAWF
jgi:hypothetical protein